jgi:SAM-dependent methyltransferase
MCVNTTVNIIKYDQNKQEKNSIDNTPKSNSGLFLFDTGVSENGVIHNSDVFGIDLDQIEGIILSHGQSYIDSLRDAEITGKLRERLHEVESGRIYESFHNLKNFVEGDYFSWYLDEWDDAMRDAIKAVVSKLSQYEIRTADLELARVQDLFKNLYQNLVPRSVRIELGEYYTPDWLAELVLNDTNFTVKYFEDYSKQKRNIQHAALDLRLLDPACGTGTFLVLAIKRIKEYADKHFIDHKLLVEKIISNIVGFDLNPLAVIASRTNYLMALGELVRFLRGKEIPIFLADSVTAREKTTAYGKNLCVLNTVVGEFSIPARIIKSKLLAQLLSTIAECVGSQYSTEEFLMRLQKEIPGTDELELDLFRNLYNKFADLESKGKNRIWTGILKNSFAPLYTEKFDYVIGNPPWISWDHLPSTYRNTLDEVWEEISPLYRNIKIGVSRSAFKNEFATLFVAVGVERYMTNIGRLGFLVPFNLFRIQAGAIFRKLLALTTKIDRIYDLVELRPFEGATNRTAMLLLSKGETSFPIKCKLWRKKGPGYIDIHSTLEQVNSETDRFDLVMEPIQGKGFPESSWLMLNKPALKPVRKAIGPAYYEAYEGINTRRANAIFYLRVLEKDYGLYYVENMKEEGRMSEEERRDYPEEKAWIESTLVYPLLRGRDVGRWFAKPCDYIIVPNDPSTGSTYLESDLKISFPKTYNFLFKFKKELSKRKYYGTPISESKPVGSKAKSIKSTSKIPMYTLFQVNKETFAEFKVVWKEIGGEISGKGDFAASVVPPFYTKSNGPVERKPIIVDHKLMLVPCKNEDEAYFVAGILNSSIARLIVASYTIENAMSTHILKHIRIPQYTMGDATHKSIVKESRMAHALSRDKISIREVESCIDKHVARLFGINNNQLNAVKKSLEILGKDAS